MAFVFMPHGQGTLLTPDVNPGGTFIDSHEIKLVLVLLLLLLMLLLLRL